MFNRNNQYYPYNNGYNSPYSQVRSPLAIGCSLLTGALLLLVCIGLLIYVRILNQPLLPDFVNGGEVTLETLKPAIILLIAVLLGIFGVMLLIGPRGRRIVGRIMGIIYAVAIVAALCGFGYWSFFINPYVGMTRTSFARANVSIDTGSTLHFQNPKDGVTQILCIGHNQDCKSNPDAPDALNHGIQVAPGQTVDIKFDNEGNFEITSKTTPHMNMHVDVTVPDNSGGD